MANDYDAYWWRGVRWLDWLDEASVVDRPVEVACMRRLAMQSVRALEHLARVREFIFRRAVREVLYEARGMTPPPHRLTLREVHARRGIELQWKTEVTKRGNVFITVVEVEIPKAA